MALFLQTVNPQFAVTGQIAVADVAEVAAKGFKTLINNRPDHEGGADQPTSKAIEAAAKAAGLHYIYLPVVSGAVNADQARSLKQQLQTAPKPALAFCRSGARSAMLHTLSESA